MGQILGKLKAAASQSEPQFITSHGNGPLAASEVLFFPDTTNVCKNWITTGVRGCLFRDNYSFMQGHFRFGSNCRYAHQETPFARLLRQLQSANKTMDICVFTITNNMIRDAIIAQHKRGVRVRIVTDDEQAHSNGSDISELVRAGIRVVHDKSQYHMHHKFCIIDGHKLLNGSLNWSVQGVRSNQENVMITTDPALVRPFCTAFDTMWRNYARNIAS